MPECYAENKASSCHMVRSLSKWYDSGILHGIRLWRGKNRGGIGKERDKEKGRKYESAVSDAESVGI